MIGAKIVADSINYQGDRLTTLEVVLPRYILAELNTHRAFSRNSASSRAIPFNKMVKSVEENTFIPYAWQKDHKGMQGTEYFTDIGAIRNREAMWLQSRNYAIVSANNLSGLEVTKQLCNRLLEPFMYHTVLLSATEWENFFKQRCPEYTLYSTNKEVQTLNCRSWKDLCRFYNVYENATILEKLKHNKGQADIHMMFLAEAIYDAIQESTPKELKEGEYHLPYGDSIDYEEVKKMTPKRRRVHPEDDSTAAEKIWHEDTQDNIFKITVARCARLSYKTLGENPVIDYMKDLALYYLLLKSGHWSPFEHVARAMTEQEYATNVRGECDWDEIDQEEIVLEENAGYCRNYRGFIQLRSLVDTK